MCSAAALTFAGPPQRCRKAGSWLTFHASCVKSTPTPSPAAHSPFPMWLSLVCMATMNRACPRPDVWGGQRRPNNIFHPFTAIRLPVEGVVLRYTAGCHIPVTCICQQSTEDRGMFRFFFFFCGTFRLSPLLKHLHGCRFKAKACSPHCSAEACCTSSYQQ